MLGETWKDISPDSIKNGFRKAGIQPFNSKVISEEQFLPEALKRYQASIGHTDNQQCSSNEQDQPSTSTKNRECSASERQEVVKASIETLILSAITQKTSIQVQKRRKICPGAEVISSLEVLRKIREKKQAEKDKKQQKKEQQDAREKKKNEKQATKEKENRANKSTKVHLKEIEDLPEETDSDEEYEEDENSVQNQGQNIHDNLEAQVNQTIEVNKWVLVAYATKKTVKHFVGQILKAKGGNTRANMSFIHVRAYIFVKISVKHYRPTHDQTCLKTS
jgi:hypothetical protein